MFIATKLNLSKRTSGKGDNESKNNKKRCNGSTPAKTDHPGLGDIVSRFYAQETAMCEIGWV